MVQALSNEQLKAVAPSIFAQEPWERMSDKYRFVPTITVLDAMRDNGFVPVRAQQSRSRIPGKADFTKHMVRFRHQDYIDCSGRVLGEEVPEVVLMNSHDGTSAYKLDAGIFRLVCLNGMVVKSADTGSISARHSGRADIVGEVIEGSFKIIEEAPKHAEAIQQFKMIELSPADQVAFASAALAVKGETAAETFSPELVLRARRSADAGNANGGRDLWRTMNVVQEHIIRGGARTWQRNAETGQSRRTSLRAVNSVTEDVRINKALWMLTEHMAGLKTGVVQAA